MSAIPSGSHSHKSIELILVLILLLILVSCSNSSDPATPGLTSTPVNSMQSQTSSHSLLWYGLIAINPDLGTAELVPARNLKTHFNVRTFMEEGPCTDCLQIQNFVAIPGDIFEFDVVFSHPFPGLDQFSGFDVRGIVYFNGNDYWPSNDLTASDFGLGEGELLNPDGYTRLYNPVEFPPGSVGVELWEYSKGRLAPDVSLTASLNGYKAYQVNNIRRCFFTTDAATAHYEIKIPDGPFLFGYAVDACRVKPDPTLTGDPTVVDVPWDFPLEANCDEAYFLSTSASDGLFSNGNGAAEILVDVYDWQSDAISGGVTIECPAIFDGLVELFNDGSGSLAMTRFEGEVTNELEAPVGNYEYLVAATDHLDASSPLPLVAYTFGTISVSEQLLDPIAIAGHFPTSAGIDEDIHFFDDGSYDPDGGDITLVEWDWDNDGIFDSTGSEDWHSWDSAGIYSVQMRVTDDEAATGVLEEPLQVIIPGGDIPLPFPITTLTGYYSPYYAKVDTVTDKCWFDCTQAAPVKDFGFYTIDDEETVEKVWEKPGAGFQGMPGMFGLSVDGRALIAPDILGVWPMGNPIDIWMVDDVDGHKVNVPVDEDDEVSFCFDADIFYELGTAVVCDGGPANRIVTWDWTDTDPVFTEYPCGGFASMMEADYEGERLFLFCAGSAVDDPAIQVWDAATWMILTEFNAINADSAFMTDIDYNPEFKQLYFGCGPNSLEIWDTETYEHITNINVPGGEVMGVDHMGNAIYLTYIDMTEHGHLMVLDAATLEIVWDVPAGFSPGIVACNPNNSKIYIVSMSNGTVHVMQG